MMHACFFGFCFRVEQTQTDPEKEKNPFVLGITKKKCTKLSSSAAGINDRNSVVQKAETQVCVYVWASPNAYKKSAAVR